MVLAAFSASPGTDPAVQPPEESVVAAEALAVCSDHISARFK